MVLKVLILFKIVLKKKKTWYLGMYNSTQLAILGNRTINKLDWFLKRKIIF